LGSIGSLVAGFHAEETDNAGPGTAAPQSMRYDRYGLTLSGGVANMPLSYSFSYGNEITDNSGETGYSRQERQMQINFSAPTPPGKAASVSYTNDVVDFRNEPVANGNTSYEMQNANWSFRVNPRLTGQVAYGVTSSTDLLSRTSSKETQSVAGSMNYDIPGQRGAVTSGYSQGVDRSPSLGAQSVSTVLNLESRFKLGRLANVRFFYNQLYGDSTGNPFVLATGTDRLITGVSYHVDSDYGLVLDATWQQDFMRNTSDHNPTGVSTNVATVLLGMSYRPPATGWLYTLSITSKDETKNGGTTINNPTTYGSYNNVQATVTYNF
jgi:hypothetical protein